MDKKYWVPALEKADIVLHAIAAEPGRLKLIDLSRRLNIHKSSMFSLLHTMEALRWVERETGDTYRLGGKFAGLGALYFQQFNLLEQFQREAAYTRELLGETIQLARLDGREVVYLAKVDAPGPVRIVSDPGTRFPAHETALGKSMLAELSEAEFRALYPENVLPQTTPYSLASTELLWRQLGEIRENGYAVDQQESVIGFCCVAAAVYNEEGRAMTAVSISMPLHHWAVKMSAAAGEVRRLSAALSLGVPRPKSQSKLKGAKKQ